MVPEIEPGRPPLARCEDLAHLIDHTLLRPELTDDDVIAGCRVAQQYGVASVSVRPCDIELAVRELQGSSVKVGSVAGFPHGSSTTSVKVYEARDALRRGAREIDMAPNIARLRSRQFQYVESELLQMADACHKEGALLKVIFENAWLSDELKIVACRISVRAGVDFASGEAPRGPAADACVSAGKHWAEGRGCEHPGTGQRSLWGGLHAHRHDGHGGHFR